MNRLRIVTAAVLLLGACADAADPQRLPSPLDPATAPAPLTVDAPTTTSPPSSGLPPHRGVDLMPILDPLVAPVGYSVSRAALIDRTTYQPRSDGTHLAVYVTPDADIPADRYAADLAPLARTMVGFVFQTWGGLASFDLCQEPFGRDHDGQPEPLTLLDITRDAAATIEWSSAGLDDLVSLGRERTDVTVWAAEQVRTTATWTRLATGDD